MPIATTEELDYQTSRRVASDTKLANYLGTLHGTSDQGVSQKAPNYAAYGTLVDLTNNDNITKSMWRLDANKNSKLVIYNSAGVMVITNPRAIKFNGCSLSTVGEMLVVDINANVLWWTEMGTVLTAGDLPANWFGTGLVVGVSTFSVIAASMAVVTSVRLIGRRAKLG